ncbi:S66 peptidase family protein [Inhella gelatinilytica]|uniref:LD-carboxypeptidase n=1 Tax=Inhella gelatinilytica TaxID=2795030 RepID=A0A931ITT1_9BURK|nr:LD-carboxypeptidase [Inhella gelatinilytica]MBH9552637.1 LD-carboxypeptidase [Inhella gelatinilytica]
MTIRALEPGACLGVIAPAGPPKAGALEAVPAQVAALGYRAKIFPGCAGPAELGFLAASDAQRVADVHAALLDPEVDALLCLRGGYGCLRVVDRMDRELLRSHPKPLIGYSDITTLLALWAQEGLAGWHAPMPASDWGQPGGEDDRDRLGAALRSGCGPGWHRQSPELHPLSRRGVADREVCGPLLGGNLAVWASGLGTGTLPDPRGALLFFEDIGEEPYRVDRFLTQLRLAGHLDAAAGFVVGRFSEAPDATAVLAAHLHPLGKPVLAGWPSGHGQPNWPLPIGVRLTLDVHHRTLRWP